MLKTLFQSPTKILLLFVLLQSFVLLPAQETATVTLEHAESLTFDKSQSAERQVLKGSVRFRHKGAVMFCDSAYFYSATNSLDAFGHVRMVQGDTLFVYGDVLYYDGNKQLALLRRNVRMVNRDVTLTTENLDYNRADGVGYYFDNGKIVDATNELVSERGYYYPNRRLADFKKDVVLTNPEFVLKSDTLNYNTQAKVAFILGPSTIDYKDDTHIYSELGTYNTETQNSSLFNRSLIETKEGRFLTGDTIYYDKTLGIGRTLSNIELTDTIQKVMLTGDLGFYNEKTQEGFVTKHAMAIDYSTADSLFLHADSLFFLKDSIYNLVKAYRHVRFYRTDLQGKCDSLTYASRDSLISMYHNPVVWSERNQLTGNLIQAFMRDSTIEYIRIIENSMAVMQDEADTLKFNQLLGKEIKGYLQDQKLYKIDVSGNTQSIYFPRDEDDELIGVNRTESPFMTVYLKENKVDKVVLFTEPSGKMMPEEGLVKEDIFFPQFVWYDTIRPKKKEDIFIQTEPVLEQKRDERDSRRGRRR